MKNLRYNSGGIMAIGVILCLVGTYIWISNYYPELDLLGFLNLEKNWPFFLVAFGFYLVLVQYNNWDDSDTQ